MNEKKCKIINLIENTEGKNQCLYEHGLSFYIETEKHKILVDTGASDAFLWNAKKLGVDIKEIDTVILSHGHYDHAGGILAFARENPSATIYMQDTAGREYYHKNDTMEKYIGIDPRIMELPQVVKLCKNYRIDEELSLFSGVTGRKLWPLGNKELMIKKEGSFEQDEFAHEQYLVVETKNRKILISGCAHNGILNILEEYKKLYGTEPDIVISGFHMQKKNGYTEEDIENIQQIAKELKQRNTIFYTGHCTGELPFALMKNYMKDQLVYIHSGDEIPFA